MSCPMTTLAVTGIIWERQGPVVRDVEVLQHVVERDRVVMVELEHSFFAFLRTLISLLPSYGEAGVNVVTLKLPSLSACSKYFDLVHKMILCALVSRPENLIVTSAKLGSWKKLARSKSCSMAARSLVVGKVSNNALCQDKL